MSPVVTVSVGVCCARGTEPGSAEALLRAADEQLYLAKETGRNRACGGVMTVLAAAADISR